MKLNLLFVLLFSFYCHSQKKTPLDIELKVTCEKVEKKNDDGFDEIIVKTCYLKNYKFVSTGSPDYKGRYFWEYQVYKLVNKKYVAIKNSDIFINSKYLEKYINNEIKKLYESDKKIMDNSQCVSFIKLRPFQINEMGIDFNHENKMVFNTSFGLPSACLNVDRNMLSMDLNQIKPYLK